jgi:hypothetical protein
LRPARSRRPVLARLLERQRLAASSTSRRVADHRREVADDEHGLMAEILELPELAQHDGVAQVEVRPARVAAELDDERPAGLLGLLQLLGEGVFGEDLLDAAANLFELDVDRRESGHGFRGTTARRAMGSDGQTLRSLITFLQAPARFFLGDVGALVV